MSWDRCFCSPSQSWNPHPTLHGPHIDIESTLAIISTCFLHVSYLTGLQMLSENEIPGSPSTGSQCWGYLTNTAWMWWGNKDHLTLPTEQVSGGHSTQVPQSACVKSPLSWHYVNPRTKLGFSRLCSKCPCLPIHLNKPKWILMAHFSITYHIYTFLYVYSQCSCW